MRLHMIVFVALVAVLSTAGDVYADANHGKTAGRTSHVFSKPWFGVNKRLFGIGKPLSESAPETSGAFRSQDQSVEDQVLLARRLSAEYVTREAGNATDMMVLWPNGATPTHLITCVEGGREIIDPATGKLNPSVQRIDLATGGVETVVRGMSRCDGIRSTSWGTVLATEEAPDGGAYEIMDPLTVTGQAVLDRVSGAVSDPAHLAKRAALPTMSWEGLTVLGSGVVIGGDELRPGSGTLDTDGGAVFKFVPAQPWDGVTGVHDLDDSPLAGGNVYAMSISCRDEGSSSFPQYGQGCEVGQGAWVKVNAATARADADANGATGYYRPEDLHRDPVYDGEGVRFCWTNTGNESAGHYAEVMCAVDRDPAASNEVMDSRTGLMYLADASYDYAVVTANRFVEGDTDFNSFDNLAFQPNTGNLYVVEDHPNGDIFACLTDGPDRDIKTDGCVKAISVKDSSAEPTGFIFTDDGRTAYLSIQHSNDADMPLVDDYPTDDLLRITGF